MKPDRGRMLFEGLIAGLIGYAVIVLFYGVWNLLSGRAFYHTAEMLGRGLVAAPAPGAAGVAAGAVLAFNGLHLVVFLLLGVVAAILVFQTERQPAFFVLVLFLAIGGFFLSLAGFLALAAGTGLQLPWGTVAIANVLAGVGMGAWLARAHPRLWSEIRDHLDPEDGREGGPSERPPQTP